MARAVDNVSQNGANGQAAVSRSKSEHSESLGPSDLVLGFHFETHNNLHRRSSRNVDRVRSLFYERYPNEVYGTARARLSWLTAPVPSAARSSGWQLSINQYLRSTQQRR